MNLKYEVLRYLGYFKKEPDEQTSKLIDVMIEKVQNIASSKYTYAFFPINVLEDRVELVGTDFVLNGGSIVKHLQGCFSCALMASTIGARFDMELNKLEKSDLLKSVVFDSCGSAMVEVVCDQAETEIIQKVGSLFFTKRYSPGYGDLPMDTQQIFQKILMMDKKLGITLTKDNLMIPRKSVTAIIGFADGNIPGILEKQANGREKIVLDKVGGPNGN